MHKEGENYVWCRAELPLSFFSAHQIWFYSPRGQKKEAYSNPHISAKGCQITSYQTLQSPLKANVAAFTPKDLATLASSESR